MSAPASSRRTRSVTPVLTAAALSLTACGGTAHDQPPAATSEAPSSSPGTVSGTGTGSPTTGRGTSAEAGATVAGEDLTPDQEAELQQAVDQGHQPWRTDPAAVAQAFVAARFGWSAATATSADGHTVDVTDPASGAKASLDVAQPVRPGAGGIWVVVGGTRTG